MLLPRDRRGHALKLGGAAQVHARIVGAEAQCSLGHVDDAGNLLDPGISYPRDGGHVDPPCPGRSEQRKIEREQGVHRAASLRQRQVDLFHQPEPRMVQQGEGVRHWPLGLNHHRHSGLRRVNVAQHGGPMRRSDPFDAATAHCDVERIAGEVRGPVHPRH